MTRWIFKHATAFALAAGFLLFAAAPALAGPPWISVELPANPHHPDTRGALALVHTFHHGDAVAFPLRGEAVGLTDGARRTVALEVTPTYRPGVYAVRGTLPDGAWVLKLTMAQGDARATALVALGSTGEVTAVRVPHDVHEGWRVPRDPTNAEVESLLRTAVALSDAEAPRRAASLGGAWAAGVLLLLLGSGAALRRRVQR